MTIKKVSKWQVTHVRTFEIETHLGKNFDWKVGQTEATKLGGLVWTDERKRAHSERMKKV